jgi:hypothetical protein
MSVSGRTSELLESSTLRIRFTFALSTSLCRDWPTRRRVCISENKQSYEQRVTLLAIQDTPLQRPSNSSSRNQTETIMSHNLSELAGLREQILGSFPIPILMNNTDSRQRTTA